METKARSGFTFPKHTEMCHLQKPSYTSHRCDNHCWIWWNSNSLKSCNSDFDACCLEPSSALDSDLFNAVSALMVNLFMVYRWHSWAYSYLTLYSKYVPVNSQIWNCEPVTAVMAGSSLFFMGWSHQIKWMGQNVCKYPIIRWSWFDTSVWLGYKTKHHISCRLHRFRNATQKQIYPVIENVQTKMSQKFKHVQQLFWLGQKKKSILKKQRFELLYRSQSQRIIQILASSGCAA